MYLSSIANNSINHNRPTIQQERLVHLQIFLLILSGSCSHESHSEAITELGCTLIWDYLSIDDKGKIDYRLCLWVNLKWIEWSGERCVLMRKRDVRHFVSVCSALWQRVWRREVIAVLKIALACVSISPEKSLSTKHIPTKLLQAKSVNMSVCAEQ